MGGGAGRAHRLGGLRDSEIDRIEERAGELVQEIEGSGYTIQDLFRYARQEGMSYTRDTVELGDRDTGYTPTEIWQTLPNLAKAGEVEPVEIYETSPDESMDLGDKAKRFEYLVRSLPSCDRNEEVLENSWFFQHPNMSQGSSLDPVPDIYAQYLPLLEDSFGEEKLSNRIIPRVQGVESAEMRAAFYTDDCLVSSIETENGAVELEGIRPRIRSMGSPGKCYRLEKAHYQTLFDDENHAYTGENLLIKVDGELVGSLKRIGDRSMIALRDVENDGGTALKKGWAYALEKNLTKQLQPRKGEGFDSDTLEIEEKEGWKILDVPELRVDPLRPAGRKGNRFENPEDAREKIDARREKLLEEISSPKSIYNKVVRSVDLTEPSFFIRSSR